MYRLTVTSAELGRGQRSRWTRRFTSDLCVHGGHRSRRMSGLHAADEADDAAA